MNDNAILRALTRSHGINPDLTKRTRRGTISTEDNSKVEVNVNIDTEDEPMDNSDVQVNDDENQEEVTEATTNLEEAQAESDKAEDDLAQLQDAQDSLESISLILQEEANKGGLSPTASRMYAIACESITGIPPERLGVPSLEAFGNSRLMATGLALESHKNILKEVRRITMEQEEVVKEKITEEVVKANDANDALLKRAEGLLKIAESSANEHAETKEISVNGQHEVQLDYLTKVEFDSEETFKSHVDNFMEFFTKPNPISIEDGKLDTNIFNTEVMKNTESGKTFKTFGANITCNEGIWKFDELTTEEEGQTLPTLTASTSKEVIQLILNDLKDNAPVLQSNINKLTEANKNLDGGEERKFTSILQTLNDMNSHKAKVYEQLLNYINLSLTNREIN